ncbi:sister chromatid cohesion and DNA repair protein (BimD), putative [Paecilomyces variotii No. 5]|uniref:Sister chromatid cohesion and DNA repair protein (BimD), putative n=1 Tax=Byssochlamys spectabilis (strain No. 5 / NBRC 109023) TaxID=1356009 RepID=V5FT71_BYSSN|nr:sister chromatid cohesion and DNA repair protein (BimD), putative [Paecilomyces variotii No. 5]
MPARTRQAPSAATETLEPEEEQGGLQKLRFNEPLSWRVGKPAIPVADLLQRLQKLGQELRKLEQEETDKDSLRKVSQELASAQLLAHRDKGVRAWTACCIVDVLRLCAPDAPFTGNQLKDIFTCIITTIIPALADPSNAYNSQHIYVLNSLAEVKSIVLLTDIDSADALMLPLFTSCFDIVSGSSKASTGEEVAKNVEYDMTRLLVTVIDEAPTLAPEVVDIIVAQFLRVDPRVIEPPTKKGKKAEAIDSNQDTLLLKDYPPAYNMAKAICQACPEKMTSHISQYFNNVIIDASAASKMEGSSKHNRRVSLDDSDDEREDVKELSKAHRLIRELWRACPDVLQNVIPQLEAELSAESVSLRLLATQTIGDLAAGIGVAGPPPPPPMNPAAYPPVTLIGYSESIPQPNVLLTPLAPKPFSQAHSSAYESFLSRRQDKSASIRAAWATAAGRIVLTSAGGSGLSESEEQSLVTSLTNTLRDADEKVRLAAVEVISLFGFSDIIKKLAVTGGLSTPDSTLSVLAERVKDRKPQVRELAMKILARMWAVSAGEIQKNNELVVPLLKDAPSKIFDAYYTNDPDIHALIDRVLFEVLLPLSYPPIKSKPSKGLSTPSKRLRGSQNVDAEAEDDADKIRVLRILTLLRCLDDKAKKVFFAFQARQLTMRSAMTIYLQACEEYNGGVINKDEQRVKAQLTRVVDGVAKTLPDSNRVSADLWKFAKMHDRRNYQLMRFAMAAVSDYRTVTKALKELAKRIQSGNSPSILDTITPLLYRCSSLVFNRSHIPAIIQLSRSEDKELANTAHEMLKEISSRNPEVLEAQVQEMCRDLEAQAPTSNSADDAGTEEILKACSGFAKKLPSKLPKERKFLQALVNYALYSSSPHSAKHAVSIIMAAADKKEMYAKDLVQKCVKKWGYGGDHFLTRLAAISQLNLLAPREADEESDLIVSIAVNQVLLTNRSPQPDSDYKWSDDEDEETIAKEWALKTIVNRLRAKEGSDNDDDFRAHAEPVYSTLNKLVAGEGELSKKKDTPATQKPRLRLLAAKLLIKLCASRVLCDQLLSPKDFNSLALVAQDPLLAVRAEFIGYIKKKLVQKTHLSARWYTIPCLLAFEPHANLKDSTLTWLRSRANFFARQSVANGKRSEEQTAMESIFSRLLSLLAYHPDYPPPDVDESTRAGDLADFSRYILFYLSAIANENNLSLIFHIAQRVKQTKDGIVKSEEMTTRLHTLSDLAQATIRRFADIYSHQHKFAGASGGSTNLLQTYPGKMRLPSALFASMLSHQEAQDAAEKNYLSEDIEDILDRIVRSWMKPRNASAAQNQAKKRKSDFNGNIETSVAKKAKKTKGRSLPIRRSSAAGNPKLPKKKKKADEDSWGSDDAADVTSSARRRSSRGVGRKSVSYADRDSDEDDLEMDQGDGEEQDEDEGEEENSEESAAEEDQHDEPEEQEEQQSDEEKNGDDEDEEMENVEEPSPPPAKKSTRAKLKSTPAKTKASKVSDNEENGHGEEDDDEMEEAEASPPPEKSTRSKRKSTTPAKAKATNVAVSVSVPKRKSEVTDTSSKKTRELPARRSTRRG